MPKVFSTTSLILSLLTVAIIFPLFGCESDNEEVPQVDAAKEQQNVMATIEAYLSGLSKKDIKTVTGTISSSTVMFFGSDSTDVMKNPREVKNGVLAEWQKIDSV